jgi:hypothetical protein
VKHHCLRATASGGDDVGSNSRWNLHVGRPGSRRVHPERRVEGSARGYPPKYEACYVFCPIIHLDIAEGNLFALTELMQRDIPARS